MDQDETLHAFLNAAGPDTDPEVARALLEMHNWNLDSALSEVIGVAPQQEVRSPMQTGRFDQLLPSAPDDEMAMAMHASLQHHNFRPQHQQDDGLGRAMEASFSDHMERAMALSKMDNDYDRAIQLSKGNHSRGSQKSSEGAPDGGGTFDQVSNMFPASVPSSSAAPARVNAKAPPTRAPGKAPVGQLFGGRTYNSASVSASSKGQSQGASQSRSQAQGQQQQTKRPPTKATGSQRTIKSLIQPIAKSARTITPPSVQMPIQGSRLTGAADHSRGAALSMHKRPSDRASSGQSSSRTSMPSRASVPETSSQRRSNGVAESASSHRAHVPGQPRNAEPPKPKTPPAHLISSKKPDAGLRANIRSPSAMDNPPRTTSAVACSTATRATPQTSGSVASSMARAAPQISEVTTSTATADRAPPEISGSVASSTAGDTAKVASPAGTVQKAGVLRGEKWLQELEAEQRRKNELEQAKAVAQEQPSTSACEPEEPTISNADKEKELEKQRDNKSLKRLQSLKRLPPEQLQGAVKTLHAYISNLAKNPLDEKFHKINTENKNFAATVAPHEDAVELLKLCGFQVDGTMLIMDQAFMKSKGSFLWGVLAKLEVLRR